jgi:coenzyme F420 biosynthesis associated uncharacterized protein
MSATVRGRAEHEYSQLLEKISEPLAAYTGTGLKVDTCEVLALDRPDWIRANVANFRELLRPFEELYQETTQTGRFDLPGVTAVGRLVLSGEVGVLLGYLARRVLGQYDISLLGAEAPEPGKLYFVEPNILAVESRLGLPREEFRTWLALHEATHIHEFEGHPWVRQYMHRTLHDYLQSMVEHVRDGQGLGAFLSRAVDSLWIGGTLLEAVMTPQQQELVSRVQALMCLLEGYSNHVMDTVGREMLPHFTEIERRVEQRSKQRGVAEQLFLRLTGLQMKMDQYRLGEAFVNRIGQDRGIAFMNQVWNGPENLPTEQEIREPTQWIARMERIAA